MSIDLKKFHTQVYINFLIIMRLFILVKLRNQKNVYHHILVNLLEIESLQIKFLTNKVETFTTKNEVEALLLEQCY